MRTLNRHNHRRQRQGLTFLQQYTPTLKLNFVDGSAFDPRVTFARPSAVATRTNSSGLIETIAANVPRITYDPITLACKGLLLEEQRTNLLAYSEQLDNAIWTKSGLSTVTPNVLTAPTGSLSADQVSSPPNDGPYQSVASTTGTAYASSVHIKNGNAVQLLYRDDTGAGRHIVINPTTNVIKNTSGTLLASGVTTAANGYYRYYMAYQASGALVRGQARNDATGTVSFGEWGVQIEAGAMPTSYIPTSASPITRAADSCAVTGTNFTSWYKPEPTIVIKFAAQASGTRTYLCLSDSTANNRIELQSINGVLSLTVVSAGVSTALALGSVSTGADYTVAVALGSNAVAASINGAASVSATSSVPTVDRAHIGMDYASANICCSTIAAINVYPACAPKTLLPSLSK